MILIESKWNLKEEKDFIGFNSEKNINRIKVEFKGSKKDINLIL